MRREQALWLVAAQLGDACIRFFFKKHLKA